MQQNEGLGDTLPGANNGGSVGQRGEESAYQYSPVEGSQTSNYDLRHVKSTKSSPHANGQRSSTDVLTENGVGGRGRGTRSSEMNQIAQKI